MQNRTPTELQSLARSVQHAQDSAQQIAPFTVQYPDFDLDAGYSVAHMLHQARLAEGARSVGRKIGFTNSALWQRFNVYAPVWGHVYDRTVVQLAEQEAVCSLGRFVHPKIEPEIVLHFRSAPPAGGDLAAILDCVDWVAHAFEIVHCHFPDWKFQAPDAVADGALHATLLLGQPQSVAQLGADPVEALASFAIDLLCDGQLRERGEGRNVLGNPVAAIAHLVDVLASQTQYAPLQADELVTTGTLTQAFTVLPGETWRTDLHGIALPGLSVSFTD